MLLILKGHMPYEWFGFSVKVKYGMITVGAPQSRICAMLVAFLVVSEHMNL